MVIVLNVIFDNLRFLWGIFGDMVVVDNCNGNLFWFIFGVRVFILCVFIWLCWLIVESLIESGRRDESIKVI